ncbi:MAG: DUF167 domain-containing protein [Methanomassiliicoccaceae archaeon]|nr:DUF167 domain-containing protein [Methanomassiliicoccaceae archaeon]
MDIRAVSRPVKGGAEVDITVSPNSDIQLIGDINEWKKRLIVRIRSPPVDGKANREAEEFMEHITKCRSEIIRGHTSRRKTVMIYGEWEKIISSLEGTQ